MHLDEWRRELRIALARDEATRIVDLVMENAPKECLQAIGSALLHAVDAENLSVAAGRCAQALRQRDWEGDAELAASLDAGGASSLNAVPVDLEALADVLHAGAGEDPGLLDLRTGDVWPAVALDYARETDDSALPPEPEGVAALEVVPEGSAEPYRDMQHFIGRVTDPVLAQRLLRAIEGKGAFRRFRTALDDVPIELTRWDAFSDDRRLGHARAWLADAGFQPLPRRA